MKKTILIFSSILYSAVLIAQQPAPVKPRILVSTDIGGTDPDDNQSMTHLLMYGANWYTDKSDPQLYDGKIQGGKTVSKWRNEILLDWEKRWEWLK